MDLRVTGLQHIGIPTKCVEKTIEFFTRLGFVNVYQKETDDVKVYFLQLQNVIVEIYPREVTAGVPGAIDHIALDTADVEKAYEQIAQEGFEILDGGLNTNDFWANGTKYFTILGPNGEKVEFSQYL